MKGLAAGLAMLSSLMGFNGQWLLGDHKNIPQQEEIVVQAENIDEVDLTEVQPSDIIVQDTQNLVDIIGSLLPESLHSELELYNEFAVLQSGNRIHIEYQDTVAQRIFVQKSKYEQLRVELLENPSIAMDTFPLDVKSLVMTFDQKDLFNPSQDLLDLLDASPGLLSVIDNQVDIVKGLKSDDTIEILAAGRYREDVLERLDSVLSVRINQTDKSTMLFKFTQDGKDVWYDESLEPCTFPFLYSPTDYIIISSLYGVKRGNKIHKGIDFAADIGTPIYATADGVVAESGWGNGYGLRIRIAHDQFGDYDSLYAHMSRTYVKAGEIIRQGQKIGLVGNTGRSTGPHLHYEVRYKNAKINPRGSSLKKRFVPNLVDKVVLQDYKASVDQVFVEATNTVVDVALLLQEQKGSL